MELGKLLDIPNSELKIIKIDNPNNAKMCCDTMLDKWLEIDPTASWAKILTAIRSPALYCKGEYA